MSAAAALAVVVGSNQTCNSTVDLNTGIAQGFVPLRHGMEQVFPTPHEHERCNDAAVGGAFMNFWNRSFSKVGADQVVGMVEMTALNQKVFLDHGSVYTTSTTLLDSLTNDTSTVEDFDEVPSLWKLPASLFYREKTRLFNRRRLSSQCSTITLIKVAVVYDSEFCHEYGSHAAARERIRAIVAAASIHYERTLCIQLKLRGIRTPDKACHSIPSKTFSLMNRGNACTGKDSLLYEFAAWMRNTGKPSLNLNSDWVFFFFTGTPAQGSLGCAWQGTLCWPRYSYGVVYATSRTSFFLQGIMLAHEVGHVLSAPHVDVSSRGYIMEKSLSSGLGGFSPGSIESMSLFLNSQQTHLCDAIAVRKVPQAATFTPTPRPVAPPTPFPTRQPTLPTNDDKNHPVIEGNDVCIQIVNGDTQKYACISLFSLTGIVTTTLTQASCDGGTTVAPSEDGNDAGGFFKSRHCGTPCIFLTDIAKLCILAGTDSVVELFAATTDKVTTFVVQSVVTTAVPEQPTEGECHKAVMKCV